MQGQQIASLFATVGADLTGLTGGLGQARGQLDGFAGHMTKVGGDMSRVGLGLTAAVTVPIAGVGGAALKMAADFESATNILGIAARESGTPLDDLRRAALAVGNDAQLMGIDAMEAADAMTTLYKAGFSTGEVMGDLSGYLSEGTNLTGALRSAIDLTAASDLDLARASDAVAIAMKTFGLNASEATGIADSFVGAADASVAEVSDLVDALYTFGPTANQFGWSLQDTNTALAILSERGIRGSEAGTALRSMMTNIMRGTDDTTAALEALNISLYDQDGQMRAMPDIVGQLATALGGLSEEQRNAYIQTLAGTYGMKAMATFVEEGAAGWQEMAQAIGASATAQEVAEKRTEGMNGALERFGGAVQTLGLTAADTFLPTVTDMVDGATDLTDALSKLHPDTMAGLVKGLGGLAALGPTLFTLGQIIKFLGLIPGSLLAIGGAAAILGGVLWFGSDKGDKFTESLWKLDEAVFALGGAEGLQKWIGIRQGIEGVQESTAKSFGGPWQGEPLEEPTAWDALGAAPVAGAPFRFAKSVLSVFPPADGTAGETPAALLDPTNPAALEWNQLQEHMTLETPGLDALFGEEAGLGFSLAPTQSPEEIAELAEALLPAEGSLRRGVVLDVRPDRAQIERSADEIAEVWARRVSAQLERVKQHAKIESGGLDYLMGEARAQGMTP